MLSSDRYCLDCDHDNTELLPGCCAYVSKRYGQCKAAGTVAHTTRARKKIYYCRQHWVARGSKAASEAIMATTYDRRYLIKAMRDRQRAILKLH